MLPAFSFPLYFSSYFCQDWLAPHLLLILFLFWFSLRCPNPFVCLSASWPFPFCFVLLYYPWLSTTPLYNIDSLWWALSIYSLFFPLISFNEPLCLFFADRNFIFLVIFLYFLFFPLDGCLLSFAHISQHLLPYLYNIHSFFSLCMLAVVVVFFRASLLTTVIQSAYSLSFETLNMC